ncbi:IS630 family transposase, partial [Streptomyces sp. Act-28]
EHQNQIELHFLPSYPPEPDPDEPAGTDLKRGLSHTHRARSRTERHPSPQIPHYRRHRPHVARGHPDGPHIRYALDE